MAEIRLVITDLDGTLLNGGKVIGERTHAAVSVCLAAGVRFVLASARPFCSANRYASQLGLETPLVCYNGALVRDPSGNTLFSHPLSVDLARDLASFAREEELYMKVFGDDEFFVESRTAETGPYSARYFVPYREAGNMVEFIGHEGLAPYSFVIHAPPERLPAVRKAVKERFGDRVIGHCPNEHAIHMSARGASKLIALKMLAGDWGLSPNEVMAVGDGDNDIEMLEWAGTGVAVANACAELRDVADFISAGNEEDGVGLALEHCLDLLPPSSFASGNG